MFGEGFRVYELAEREAIIDIGRQRERRLSAGA